MKTKTEENENKETVSLEIERKILLKRLPKIKYDEVYHIEQYYIKKGNKWVRYRKQTDSEGNIIYIKNKKEKVKQGVSREYETIISKDKFDKTLKKYDSKKYISKFRHIKYFNDNKHKWEIDEFERYNIVIAEVELEKLNESINIPKYISDVYIKDVTKFREFSNRKLSEYL